MDGIIQVIVLAYLDPKFKLQIVQSIVSSHTFVSPADSRGAVVSNWQKCVHEVLVNRLGGLSLPRKSVLRLTDRPNMTLDVYHGRKTTAQLQQQQHCQLNKIVGHEYVSL